MKSRYKDFLIRDWVGADRASVIAVISSVLAECGLQWEPEGADMDAIEVEKYYRQAEGEFWVVEYQNKLVGTAAYYPISRGENAVEIRKMYLLPSVRGQGLGKFLLQELESAIASRNFEEIWIQTSSELTVAVKLYEKNGYKLATGEKEPRCDRVYVKYLR